MKLDKGSTHRHGPKCSPCLRNRRDSARRLLRTAGPRDSEAARHAKSSDDSKNADADVQKMVTFRIAKEEFAFNMEHVREILRVQTPNQVPDVPDYVLGVLTVRGQILPVIDLRRLLQQRSLADEFADSCRPLRDEYERWMDQTEKVFAAGTYQKADSSVMEHLRKWLAETNSSSQLLMEALAKARGLNEKVHQTASGSGQTRRARRSRCRAKLWRGHPHREPGYGRRVAPSSKKQIAQNIQEDQRIIVVDAAGFMLGLVVDHVHEVLNIPKNLMEPPPAHHLERGNGTIRRRQIGRRRPINHATGRRQPDERPEAARRSGLLGAENR